MKCRRRPEISGLRLRVGLAAAVLAGLTGLGATACLAQEGFKITIDGTQYEIGLDRPKEIVLPDGGRVSVLLEQDEYTTYRTDAFSFSHKSHYKPARTDLGSGIFQTAILTPLGTGVLIQEYTTLDPSPLVDLMVQEITKEEIGYGYEYEEKVVRQKVHGEILEGRRAVTSHKDESWIREVYAYGDRDSGILIVTMVQKVNLAQEGDLLKDFWRTLAIE